MGACHVITAIHKNVQAMVPEAENLHFTEEKPH